MADTTEEQVRKELADAAEKVETDPDALEKIRQGIRDRLERN